MRWGTPIVGFVGAFVDTIGGGGWGPVVTTTLLGSGHEPKEVIGSVSAAEFFITVVSGVALAFLVTVEAWETVAGLIAGGMVMAPIAAYVSGKLPKRVLMAVVGCLIVGLNYVRKRLIRFVRMWVYRLIWWRAILGSDGQCDFIACLICQIDHAPPMFVCAYLLGVPCKPRIDDLWSLAVTDPCMQVNGPFCDLADDCFAVWQQAFGDHHPMTQVGADMHVRIAREIRRSAPRIKQQPTAMGLVTTADTVCLFELQDAFDKATSIIEV
jgi:hypothetical protein